MLPSLEHVIRKRYGKRRQLRMLAVVFVVCASVLSGWALIWPLLQSGRGFSIGIVENPFFSLGLAFLPPAVALWVMAHVLARLLVPIPKARCPHCGHSVRGGQEPVCSECGLVLPDSLCHVGSRAE